MKRLSAKVQNLLIKDRGEMRPIVDGAIKATFLSNLLDSFRKNEDHQGIRHFFLVTVFEVDEMSAIDIEKISAFFRQDAQQLQSLVL